MEIKIHKKGNIKIAEIVSENIEIDNVQSALDIFANSMYQGSNKIIFYEKNITSELFDLKTGVAGEIFQKCSNYKVQLAIIGDYSKFTSKSLNCFILESNRYGQINFVSSLEEAKEILFKD